MRRRKVRIGLWVLAGVVVLCAAWAGWTAYQVNRDLSASVDDVENLRQALESGDDGSTGAAVDQLRTHSGAAASRTSGLTWSVLEHAPVFGDDATGVAVVSSVVHDLSTDGVEPLVEVSNDLESIVPVDGKVDPGAVEALQDPVAAASSAFAAADARLSEEDPSGYVERLRSKYRELASQVSDASDALSSADATVQILPEMLGVDGSRNYLLVFQNNAEIRATGGLPGAVSLVHADDGAVSMTRQVAANTFGATRRPVLPLTASERRVFDPKIGTFFLNANTQPDFGRAAAFWQARWEQVYPEKIDGVLSIDPIAVSYVLAATGPIVVDGVELSTDNAVDELLHDVYVRYSSPEEQDAFFRAVAKTMFEKVSNGVNSPRRLISALAKGADERRIYVHDFESALQDHLDGTAVAGDLPTVATDHPQVGVYLSDATPGKMSYYLRYKVDVDATYCTGGVQALTGHAQLTSQAPEDAGSRLPSYVTGEGIGGVKPGNQVVFVYIFGPVDGSVSGVALNGKPIVGFPAVDYEGRKVFTVVVELKPQQQVDLTWRMKAGAGQQGSTQVAVTPSIGSSSVDPVVASACS
jgi:hypothetical protein